MVELFAGIACACMPSASKFFSHHGAFLATLTAYFNPRKMASAFKASCSYKFHGSRTRELEKPRLNWLHISLLYGAERPDESGASVPPECPSPSRIYTTQDVSVSRDPVAAIT